MGLARAAVAESDDVVARHDIFATGEFERQRLVERGDGGEVERVEAFDRRKACGANAALDHAPFAVDEFEFDEAQQIADMIVTFARRLGGDLLIFPQDRRQFELPQMMGEQNPRRRRDFGGDRRRHAASAGNEREIVGGLESSATFGGGQIGIGRKIEIAPGWFSTLATASCLTASKLMAPSRMASCAAAATIVFGKDFPQPQDLDELAFAALAHARFQKPAQMRERLRQRPALQAARPDRARRAFAPAAPDNAAARKRSRHGRSCARWRAISAPSQRMTTSSTKPFTSTSRKP